MDGAVGIIGSEDNPANLLYPGVLAVGIVGAVLVRGRRAGMARAMCATAVTQMLVAVTAAILGWGSPGSEALEVLALNGAFAVLWLVAAWLFRRPLRWEPLRRAVRESCGHPGRSLVGLVGGAKDDGEERLSWQKEFEEDEQPHPFRT